MAYFDFGCAGVVFRIFFGDGNSIHKLQPGKIEDPRQNKKIR